MRKKILFVLLLTCILVGCTGRYNPEKVSEKFKTLVKFSHNDNFYDEKGTCYTKDGKRKACGHISFEANDPGVILKDNNFEVFAYNGEDNKINEIVFRTKAEDVFSDQYVFGVKDDREYVFLYKKDAYGFCEYVIKESKDKKVSPKAEKCKGKNKEEAKKFISDLDKKFEKYGLDKDDFVEYIKWFNEEKVESIQKDVNKNFKNQEKLTDKDVESNIGYAGSEMSDEENMLVIRGANIAEEITAVVYENDKMKLFAFTNEWISGEKDEDGMKLGYDPIGKDFYAVNTTAGEKLTCSYYIEEEKSVNGTKCTKGQISNAKSIMYYFKQQLTQWGVTLDEFIHFAENYKKNSIEY